QMDAALGPHGYTVCAVTLRDCLHLKSAVTALRDDLLLMNPAWISTETFNGYARIEVDRDEPMAANALCVGDVVIFPTAFPRTAERLVRNGLTIRSVDASEVAKAEGAVTCCSVIFDERTS